MKHYEDVWLEAEEVSSESISISNAIYNIRDHSNDLLKHYDRAVSEDGDEGDVKQMAAYLGGLLFNLARICKEFDINSWTQLEREVRNSKIDLNDRGED